MIIARKPSLAKVVRTFHQQVNLKFWIVSLKNGYRENAKILMMDFKQVKMFKITKNI